MCTCERVGVVREATRVLRSGQVPALELAPPTAGWRATGRVDAGAGVEDHLSESFFSFLR